MGTHRLAPWRLPDSVGCKSLHSHNKEAFDANVQMLLGVLDVCLVERGDTGAMACQCRPEVSSLLPLCGSLGSNSDHWGWWKTPLPTESSCCPPSTWYLFIPE